jgi:RNA polymerase sigma factor (sigma-70 family)
MENIKLIKKMAWSFHQTTGLELEELFQEAALAYCESLSTYKPERGRISTYVWTCIQNHLKNYLKKQLRKKSMMIPFTDISIEDEGESVDKLFEKLTEDTQEIVNEILHYPSIFKHLKGDKAINNIIHIMMVDYHWPKEKVWFSINQLRYIFS